MTDTSSIAVSQALERQPEKPSAIYGDNEFVLDKVIHVTVAMLRASSPQKTEDVVKAMQAIETEVRRILNNKPVA